MFELAFCQLSIKQICMYVYIVGYLSLRSSDPLQVNGQQYIVILYVLLLLLLHS